MNTPEFLKYLSIISLPLFAVIGFWIIKQSPNFSFKKGTFSESITSIEKPSHRLIFQLNFILKAVLDLGFAWYVIQSFGLSGNSSVARFLLIQNILFASLAYYVEGKYAVAHRVIIYTVGVCWLITQALLAQLTNDTNFILFTDISIVTVSLLAYSMLFARKTNSIIQIICMAIFYAWLIIFVYNYL